MEAKFRIGEKVKIANHPDKSKIGKEVEIINLHHSNFNPQKGYVDEWLYNVWDGAIFNGTYSNNVWFCMDGYIYDTYKGNPIYSSMSSIPPSWEPIAWMPKPKFEE